MDDTYRINIEKFVLYSILTVDGNAHGRTTTQGLLADETADTVELFFNEYAHQLKSSSSVRDV